MPICPSCRTENPEGQRFCGGCGSKLEASSSYEVRKIITALFCDLVGSTALGEEHDPEVLRPVLARYFDEMRTTIERHGGRVEKFIGDAIAAVFGLPVAHEDDALRAARAAIEMQERLVVLNQDSPILLVARIGVTTGEVLVPADDKPIVGDAMNTASRLESAAAPGEVLIGEPTYRLIRDAVVTEQMDSLELKGKAELVATYRLVGVASISPIRTRRLDAPMVGRSRETVLLAQAFERAVSDRSCQLFTVLGTAGAGKSRLVEEFLGTLDVAEVLQGRCLPYGDGITFYPVTEVIKGALGLADFDDESTVQERIHAWVGSQEHAGAITANLAKLLGAGEGGSSEETFWAIRRFFEIRGREQPLVVVFDDIHWGEETFLDLIEHVADWSRDAQILLLCMARPDLLDERPAWAGGKTNATTISLAPLTEDETTELIDHLLGVAGLPTEVRSRIAAVAEGNPLFVEEMFRMLIDDGLLTQDGDGWVPSGDLAGVSIPPTVSALLSARLDRLSNPERQVIECAAIEGRVFHRSAVMQLLPETEKAAIDQQLKTLTRKELVSPERSLLPGEDAFRFRHLLIRDAAYDRVPKRTRADLHEAFAGWLEQIAGDRIAEQEEIVGYHLETAHGLRLELGLDDDLTRRLAATASKHLEAAARRALLRADSQGALSLAERAYGLLPADDPGRSRAIRTLVQALNAGVDFERLARTYEEGLALALATTDRALEGFIRCHQALDLMMHRPQEITLDEVRKTVTSSVRVAEELGDIEGLGHALDILAQVQWPAGEMEDLVAISERVFDIALETGDTTLAIAIQYIEYGQRHGRTPAAIALERLGRIRRRCVGTRLFEVQAQIAISYQLLSQGQIEQGLQLFAEARTPFEELNHPWLSLMIVSDTGVVELLAGHYRDAEGYLRAALEGWTALGHLANVVGLAYHLSSSLLGLGRFEQALTVAADHSRLVAVWDLESRIALGYVQAEALGRLGRLPEALDRIAEVEALVRPTGFVTHLGEALLAKATVCQLADRTDEAVSAAREALAIFERKGFEPATEQARRLLASLSG